MQNFMRENNDFSIKGLEEENDTFNFCFSVAELES